MICLRIFIFFNKKINFTSSFVFLKVNHDVVPIKKNHAVNLGKKRMETKEKIRKVAG